MWGGVLKETGSQLNNYGALFGSFVTTNLSLKCDVFAFLFGEIEGKKGVEGERQRETKKKEKEKQGKMLREMSIKVRCQYHSAIKSQV